MMLRQFGLQLLRFFGFWLLMFTAQRIFFSIHNWQKFSEVSWGEWLSAFVQGFRLDIATASLLLMLPVLLWLFYQLTQNIWLKRSFYLFWWLFVLLTILIHAGEINAYPEWNHKLNTRVFTHLSNPDEVFRTADSGMTFWYIVYALLEIVVALALSRWLIQWKLEAPARRSKIILGSSGLLALCLLVVLSRGGVQQIPINIDSASFSKHYAANDLATNSTYYFAKSFLMYRQAEKTLDFEPYDEQQAKRILAPLFDYPVEHERYIFDHTTPNVVVVLLESWTANAIGALQDSLPFSPTPEFDKLAASGLLFTQIYACGGTSEIGNSSLFSGYPALPEISITMSPEKNRKLPSFSKELKARGYSTGYVFSGDLKYGNIAGYINQHGFDRVEDENDFPSDLPRGKLNFYDEDLYSRVLDQLDKQKEPFLQALFTGSTHSPYDFPKAASYPLRTETEGMFINSMTYADKCLGDFIRKAKEKPWFDNTIFIFVADHGHASPRVQNPSVNAYNHIPLLIWGKPLNEAYRGARIDHLGSQADIARTLMYQLKGNHQDYIWSKDLLNPKAPQFALHTCIRGYGWVTPSGGFAHHMDLKIYSDQSYPEKERELQEQRCRALMSLIYREYKDL